ncbi:Probable lipoprotein Cj1090c [hydrothermal vent metagenome]|uniref:Probable lipoprotein Cj1090c n=1 Tax=hydrothermal vent metagenome TaxID=652676 RepID=A0A1W1CXH6_9ZZZZ
MVVLLSACGYKPSSHLIGNLFFDTIYVKVEVDSEEPENAPFVKDEMNRLVYTRFKGHITSKERAKNQISLSYKGSSYTPLTYDKNGYVTRYRATIHVLFNMLSKEGKIEKSISSIIESDIQASSLTSSTLRTEAIRKGLQKALDEFLSYVSAKGMLKKSH